MARIAVDAMGGDHAPGEIVRGAIDAKQRGIDLVLVGDTEAIEPILVEHGADIPVVHAGEVIEMSDDPARAIREKKDASISVAAAIVASGDARGLVSAGSTGAALAAAAFVIGRLPGVSRPAIASFFPDTKVVLDAGANLTCRPEHLAQFAVMGSALVASHYGIERPRVGLVNIGEEEGKGRDFDKAAFDALSAVGSIEFVGNVEGRDLAKDTAEVFVTDGFTGNVVLKTAEGASRLVLSRLVEHLSRPEFVEAARPLREVFGGFAQMFDPESVGGAHLLGTRGVVVIAHGSSSRVAVANAIALAGQGAANGLVSKIQAGLATVPA